MFGVIFAMYLKTKITMTHLKQAISLGFMGSVAIFTASYFALPAWVLFIAWVSFHLFGTNAKTACYVLVQQLFGILIGMLIQYSGIYLSSKIGSLGFPIAVFIAMIGVFYISKMKQFNIVPAYFLGLITWFASGLEMNLKSLFTLLISLAVGYIIAWIDTFLNHSIDSKKVSK